MNSSSDSSSRALRPENSLGEPSVVETASAPPAFTSPPAAEITELRETEADRLLLVAEYGDPVNILMDKVIVPMLTRQEFIDALDSAPGSLGLRIQRAFLAKVAAVSGLRLELKESMELADKAGARE